MEIELKTALTLLLLIVASFALTEAICKKIIEKISEWVFYICSPLLFINILYLIWCSA